MSYTPAIDIATYQGPWHQYDEPIIMIKMSGGDNGLYYDAQATGNYYGAKRDGKAVGGYHFAGATDPIHECDFFIRAMSPLEQNDVACLDWEVAHPDPVGWSLAFVTHFHDVTGFWPLIYMNTSTLNAHDWSPVLANCGLWVADYRYTPDQDVPTNGKAYLMHQYTSTPFDHDAWFGDVALFNRYGYQGGAQTPSQPVPEPLPAPPQPVPPPVVVPDPPKPEDPNPPVDETPPPAPPAPVDPPQPAPDPQPAPSSNLPGKGILIAVLAAIAAIVAYIISVVR